MSNSTDIVNRIQNRFLDAVEEDDEHGDLAASLRQMFTEGKTLKAAQLTEAYQAAAASKHEDTSSTGDKSE